MLKHLYPLSRDEVSLSICLIKQKILSGIVPGILGKSMYILYKLLALLFILYNQKLPLFAGFSVVTCLSILRHTV